MYNQSEFDKLGLKITTSMLWKKVNNTKFSWG